MLRALEESWLTKGEVENKQQSHYLVSSLGNTRELNLNLPAVSLLETCMGCVFSLEQQQKEWPVSISDKELWALLFQFIYLFISLVLRSSGKILKSSSYYLAYGQAEQWIWTGRCMSKSRCQIEYSNFKHQKFLFIILCLLSCSYSSKMPSQLTPGSKLASLVGSMVKSTIRISGTWFKSWHCCVSYFFLLPLFSPHDRRYF